MGVFSKHTFVTGCSIISESPILDNFCRLLDPHFNSALHDRRLVGMKLDTPTQTYNKHSSAGAIEASDHRQLNYSTCVITLNYCMYRSLL